MRTWAADARFTVAIAIAAATAAPPVGAAGVPLSDPAPPTVPAEIASARADVGSGRTAAARLVPDGGAIGEPATFPARLVKGDLRTFDVSGFRIGMSAAEVQRVAADQHLTTSNGARYVPFDAERDGTRGPSFRSRVARESATRLNRPSPPDERVVYRTYLVGAGGDRYDLAFLPMEDGPRLATVMLFSSPRGLSGRSYLDAVIAKYGMPPRSSADGDTASARWCARDDAGCEEKPAFTARSDGRESILFLSGGYAARIALDKRAEAAAVAAAAAAAGKPSF